MELMDILGRYTLAKETSLILSVVGVVLAILGIIISLLSKKKTDRVKIPVIIFCAAISLGSALLIWNYNTTIYKEGVRLATVPNVEQLSYGTAQAMVRIMGLVEKPVSAGGQVISEDQIVLAQEPAGNIEVPIGTEVILRIGTGGSPEPFEPDVTPGPEGLSLSIDSLEENESFHYEYPDPSNPDMTILIEFGRGISGTFSYSRPLTEAERANWYHGGKLYDDQGNEVGQEGNWPTFWSDPDGKFALEFPKGLQAGRYTYELYQDICGQMVSDTVEFTVK